MWKGTLMVLGDEGGKNIMVCWTESSDRARLAMNLDYMH